MNHFESADRTLKKDQIAIEKILALDGPGLFDTAHYNDISMCGCCSTIGPVIEAVVELGASGTELVEYTHSGAVTGENENVVGYAWLVIH